MAAHNPQMQLPSAQCDSMEILNSKKLNATVTRTTTQEEKPQATTTSNLKRKPEEERRRRKFAFKIYNLVRSLRSLSPFFLLSSTFPHPYHRDLPPRFRRHSTEPIHFARGTLHRRNSLRGFCSTLAPIIKGLQALWHLHHIINAVDVPGTYPDDCVY